MILGDVDQFQCEYSEISFVTSEFAGLNQLCLWVGTFRV